jgi:hypothetical protein
MAYLTVNNGATSVKRSYPYYTMVDIDAARLTGHTFDHWGGSANFGGGIWSESTWVWVYSTDTVATAYFTTNTYNYRYYSGGHGRVTGDCNQDVLYGNNGTMVNCVADAGYHFVNWSDGDTHDWKQPWHIGEGNQQYTAYFQHDDVATYYTLVVTNGSGDGSYQSATDVPIVADAAPAGQHFTYWSGNTTGIANVYASSTTIHTQAANATIVANYEVDSAGPWDVLYVTGTIGAELLTDGGLEVWTDSTHLTNWSLAGTGATLDQETTNKHNGAYSAKIVTAAAVAFLTQTVNGLTAGNTYRLSGWVKAGASASGIYIKSGGVYIFYHSTPANTTEYFAEEFVADDTSVIVTCRVPAGTITSYFDAISLTEITDSYGTFTGDTWQNVANGADGTQVTAVPNSGYAFVQWNDGIITPSRTDLAIVHNLTVTAQFTLIPVIYQQFPQIVLF